MNIFLSLHTFKPLDREHRSIWKRWYGLIFIVLSDVKIRIIVVVDRPLLNIVEDLLFVFIVFTRWFLLVADRYLFKEVKLGSLEKLRDRKVFVRAKKRHWGAVLSRSDLVKFINGILCFGKLLGLRLKDLAARGPRGSLDEVAIFRVVAASALVLIRLVIFRTSLFVVLLILLLFLTWPLLVVLGLGSPLLVGRLLIVLLVAMAASWVSVVAIASRSSWARDLVLRPFVYVLFVFFLVLSILLVGLLATTASALVTSLSNASALVCAPASIISFFLWVVVPVLSLVGCRIWLVILVTPATPSLSFIELSPLCPSSTSLTLWVKHFELLTFKLAG